MFNIIKRIQLQNLISWANCVAQILIRESVVDNERIIIDMREICDEFKFETLFSFLSTFFDKNEKAIETMIISDQFFFIIQKKLDKIVQFDIFVNSIFVELIFNAFVDVIKTQSLLLNKIVSVLNQIIEPINSDLRVIFVFVESAFRIFFDDHVDAASALKPFIQREVLSSTDSTD